MRRKAKVDANQKEIVEGLRKSGCSVAVTSDAHKGFPDIVVGCMGKNIMIEIKDGKKSPSERKLTNDQVEFRAAWSGQYDVACSLPQAKKIIEEYCGVSLDDDQS